MPCASGEVCESPVPVVFDMILQWFEINESAKVSSVRCFRDVTQITVTLAYVIFVFPWCPLRANYFFKFALHIIATWALHGLGPAYEDPGLEID